jgi:zinc protease
MLRPIWFALRTLFSRGLPAPRLGFSHRALEYALVAALATAPARSAAAADAGSTPTSKSTEPSPGGSEPRGPGELAPIAIRRTRLDNGLRVVLSRDTSLPTVAICVTYDVGSRNEGTGQHGFAALLERLMFQGSRNVGPGEHQRWIAEHGGQSAGEASDDRTRFTDSLPANALALGLWLEADRMKELELSRAAYERERARARAQSERQALEPEALGARALQALVFRDYPPYAQAAGGPEAAVPPSADPLPALLDFHRRYYAPNNAVLSVAGDFEVLDALNLIQSYFSEIRSVSLSPAPGGEPPEQTEARSAVLEGPPGRGSVLWQGWAIPSRRTPEHDALELAGAILAKGMGSRLHQLLVLDKSQARSVAVWTGGHRGPDLFAVQAALAQGADPEQVRRLIQGQIASLGRFGPSAAELARAQSQLRAGLLHEIDGNRARASALADAELSAHDARLLESDFERYQRVSRQDVQRAVARYLRNASRSDVLLRPGRS